MHRHRQNFEQFLQAARLRATNRNNAQEDTFAGELVYLPTALAIKQATQRIQAGWSAAERLPRATLVPDMPVQADHEQVIEQAQAAREQRLREFREIQWLSQMQSA